MYLFIRLRGPVDGDNDCKDENFDTGVPHKGYYWTTSSFFSQEHVPYRVMQSRSTLPDDDVVSGCILTGIHCHHSHLIRSPVSKLVMCTSS